MCVIDITQQLLLQTRQGTLGFLLVQYIFRWYRLLVSVEPNLPPNMESLKLALHHFAKHVVKTASVYATVIVIFSYHVLLDKDMACTCKEQQTDCSVYMALPVFSIFFLMLWMDKTFQTACKYTGGNRNDNFCCVLCYQTVKGAFLGLLWVISVLMDGDWYVCCHNDKSEQQSLLACKDKANITIEEQGLIATLINESRVSFYLSLLTTSWFSLLLVSAVTNFVDDILTRNHFLHQL